MLLTIIDVTHYIRKIPWTSVKYFSLFFKATSILKWEANLFIIICEHWTGVNLSQPIRCDWEHVWNVTKIQGNSTNLGESINTDTHTIPFQYSQNAFFTLIESILSKQNLQGPLQTGLFFTRPMFYLIPLLCLRNLFRKSILTWHRPFVNTLAVLISTWVIWGTHIPSINPRYKTKRGVFTKSNPPWLVSCFDWFVL